MRRLGYVLSAVALCSLAIGPGFAFAAEGAVNASEKEETVHVYAHPDGSVKNEEVSVTLKNPDEAQAIIDSSSLRDLKAEDEKQSLSEEGANIIWSARGKDVVYSGATDAEAPVRVSVSYKLDGNPISASELSGKSGRVSIRYEYANESTFQALGTVLHTPFTAVTALLLDGDVFKNVSVKNGKVINDGSDAIVMGYAAPGLKESLGSAAEKADIPDAFEVEADVEGFELKTALTMVSAGLLEDLGMDSSNRDELSDTSRGLSDATAALVDGSAELASGIGSVAKGSNDMSDAARKLDSGARAASKSLPDLVSSIDKLEKGASKLTEGANQVSKGTSSLEESVAKAQEACEIVKGVLSTMGSAIETVKANNSAAQAVIAAVSAEKGIPESAKAQLAQAAAALKANDAYLAGLSAPGSTDAALQQLSTVIGQLSDGLDAKSAHALAEGAATVASGAATLQSGLDALSSGTAPLVNGVNQLVRGTSELAGGASQLAEGAKAAAQGSNELAEGMRTYSNEAIAEIIDVIDNKVISLVDRLDALEQEAARYDNFSGKTEGTKGSVRFVIEIDSI